MRTLHEILDPRKGRSRTSRGPRKALSWVPVLVTVMAGVLSMNSVVATAAHPVGSGRHSFDIQGSVRIVDDEWGGADEVATHAFTGFRDINSTTPAGQFLPMTLSGNDFCAGHEVRIHLVPQVRLNADGSGQYAVSARLYEGTSCSTTDWDGVGSLPTITHIFVNACHERTFTVRNTSEGGDYATITLRLEHDHSAGFQRC